MPACPPCEGATLRSKPKQWPSETSTCYAATQAGETLAAIGARVGLTKERVRQILKASEVAMPREYRCAAKACTAAPHRPNAYCYPHQVRFDRYGDPLAVAPRLTDVHGTTASYKYGRCRCELCRQANAAQRLEYIHRLHPEMRSRKSH